MFLFNEYKIRKTIFFPKLKQSLQFPFQIYSFEDQYAMVLKSKTISAQVHASMRKKNKMKQ